MNGMGKQKLFLVHFSHSKISMAHILNVWENNGEKSRPIHTQHKMIEYWCCQHVTSSSSMHPYISKTLEVNNKTKSEANCKKWCLIIIDQTKPTKPHFLDIQKRNFPFFDFLFAIFIFIAIFSHSITSMMIYLLQFIIRFHSIQFFWSFCVCFFQMFGPVFFTARVKSSICECWKKRKKLLKKNKTKKWKFENAKMWKLCWFLYTLYGATLLRFCF